jgi:hypothetical protein
MMIVWHIYMFMVVLCLAGVMAHEQGGFSHPFDVTMTTALYYNPFRRKGRGPIMQSTLGGSGFRWLANAASLPGEEAGTAGGFDAMTSLPSRRRWS